MDRVPPHNLEAEQSLLGSMLLSADAIPDVVESVSAEDFYRASHGRVFEAILKLYSQGEPADPITVAAELKSMGALDQVGGKPYIHTLINTVPTAANAKYYAGIVERAAVLRSLIRAATEIATLGYEAPEDIARVLDRSESLMFSVSQKRISEKFIPIKTILEESFEQIAQLYDSKTHLTGLASGFVDLDRITCGFQKSDLIIVASRPAMGKTSLVLNIAQHVGLVEKKSVAIFELEMSRHQLAQRMMCSEARVNAEDLRRGAVRDDQWPRLTQAMGLLAETPIYIDDTPGITIMELRAKARRLQKRQGLDLVIVDYLQLMATDNRAENKQQEVAEISRSLKLLARELDVPVIAVSQLSRAVESREDKRPQLSDLRESGALEQDADLVIFLYRDEYYHKDTDDKGVAEVHVRKHRNGPIGDLRLAFMPHYTRFADLAKNV